MEKSMISESVAAASPPPRRPLLISPPPAALRCCCGSVDCALLKQNCEVLETVEKDVHTAARLGQALLLRHEAYMASAERDRSELSTKIEELEAAKKDLEAENARTIEENRHLLDQLEVLNGTVMDSDTRIRTLEATLQSSQQAVRRLEGAAVRAAEMERQISVLEQEQAELQNTLILSESEARTAMSRWKRAERGIVEMQQQLEKMEREANEERHRHAEVLGRMERQREVEKELSTAAARLKGAAAAKSVSGEKGGTGVVNHFVRDLLQDNANLQLGMAELREMLLNSNDEIQALREQLMFHQPDDDLGPSTPTLRAELSSNNTTKVSQEVHVHHHYHYAPPQSEIKKAKKKRQVSASGIFTPPSLSMSPTPPLSAIPWRLNASPSPPALSNHSAKPSASTTAMTPNRWSVFSEQPSEFAPSSVPSSPVSNRRFSVFDPMATVADQGLASPTTTAEPSSPTWRTPHRRHVSEASMCSLSGSLPVMGPLMAPSPATHASSPAITIREEGGPEQAYQHNDEEEERAGLSTAADDPTTTEDEPSFSPDEELRRRPRLHRAVSHESIMSLAGGLDIHTLKARPSQLTLRPIGLGGAEATLSGIVARPVLSGSGDKRGSAVLRDNLAAMPRMVSSPLSSSSNPQTQGGLGRWAAWRPWGGPRVSSAAAAAAGAGNSHPNSPKQAAPPPPPQPDPDKLRDLLRAPGINQPGAIPGFQQYWAATKRRGVPSKVSPDVVDRDALREILES